MGVKLGKVNAACSNVMQREENLISFVVFLTMKQLTIIDKGELGHWVLNKIIKDCN